MELGFVVGEGVGFGVGCGVGFFVGLGVGAGESPIIIEMSSTINEVPG